MFILYLFSYYYYKSSFFLGFYNWSLSCIIIIDISIIFYRSSFSFYLFYQLLLSIIITCQYCWYSLPIIINDHYYMSSFVHLLRMKLCAAMLAIAAHFLYYFFRLSVFISIFWKTTVRKALQKFCFHFCMWILYLQPLNPSSPW